MRTLILLAILASTTVANAQSKRYPPEPVDKDDEAAKKSSLWEAATNPQRTPFDALVAEAQQLLEDRNQSTSAASAKEAISKLDDAIKLMPNESKAYRLRGDAHMTLSDWDRCAKDYAATVQRLKRTDVEVRSTSELRRRHGMCLARASKLADAERVLSEAAASGSGNGEIWMRLGEVRIALGKLEEAIIALESAKDHGDAPQALVRWLLAGAYDRARKPADAAVAVADALRIDREFYSLRTGGIPLLGTGEALYLMALGYSMFDPPKPELSLVHFRRFLRDAPDSPWRKRAEDHVKELRNAQLPEVVEYLNGTADRPDATQLRAGVRKLMPQLRACLAKQPFAVFRIDVTKTGPRGTGPNRQYAPSEGVGIHVEDGGAYSKTDLDTVQRCMEPIGDKLKAAMPAITKTDRWYRARFWVVSP